jgi:predicted transcriptional regulator
MNADTIESFSGWPIKFVEDLTFFYSNKNKMIVISEDQIHRIDDGKVEDLKLDKNRKEQKLSYREYLPQCFSEQPVVKDKSAQQLRPIKIISDQVRIANFITTYQKGVQYLQSFQERTHLYSRSFYYEKRARFGIIIDRKEIDVGNSIPMPFFFKWTNGRNYHFQSESIVGGYHSEFGPQIQHTPMIKTNFKSHFLNGSFEGNIAGMAAGKSLIDAADSQEVDVGLYPNYNYLLLMGFDYEGFTFKYGTIYANTTLKSSLADNSFYRQVLASDSSSLFLVQYMTRKWKVYTAYSQTDYNNKRTDLGKQVEIDYLGPTLSLLNYESSYWRAGGEYQLTDDVKLSANLIFLDGEYSEQTSDGVENFFNFKHKSLSLGITHQFSYYLQVRGKGYYINRNYDYRFTKPGSISDSSFTWGGYFELLF